MSVRLVPHIYLMTPFGVAEAHFFDSPETFETNAVWTCFQVETKECWQWPSPMIRLCESISGMRDEDYSPFVVSVEYFETLRPHILRHEGSPFYLIAKGKISMGGGPIRSDTDVSQLFPPGWMRQGEKGSADELISRGVKLPWRSRIRRWWFNLWRL